ncbi:hypothetical protein TNCV_1492531 [Trichonephila clavipes]|nr:hypothetical protein TNCV_1492531 [Trichonephila clavipes]
MDYSSYAFRCIQSLLFFNATGAFIVFPSFPLQSRTKTFSLALSSSPFQPGLSSHAFSIQGRAFSFFPSRAGTPGVGPQHTPHPFLLAGHKSLSHPPSSYLRITHQYTLGPSGPRRHNSLSNIWAHLSITPPVSIIPFSQHQKSRHDSLKTGFAYCQWGAGSPLP